MRSYEVVVIYNTNVGDSGLRTEAKKIKDLLVSNKAESLVIENWGKREFSYKMKHEKFGYYLNFIFSTENHDLIAELQRVLTITDCVIRYQTYRSGMPQKKFKINPRAVISGDSDSMDFGGLSMN
ncbi:MAG: 30S ribosomal protein S6 [bacterium]|nr:30S ribosomal protein S6 [bacterium]